MINLGVLGSGKGSNLQAIIDAIEEKKVDARIGVVISDVEDSYILTRARNHDIDARFIAPGPYKTKLSSEVEQTYIQCLKEYNVDLICLAGFMRVIKEQFLEAFPHRIINIHPSLLPAFPGLCSWRQALDYGAKITGCTVHFVDNGVDTGPIIVQKQVPILTDDTYESLHARIQEKEHIAYPEAIDLIGKGRIEIVGRKVIVK
ncbi:phosphoribosylglycinamide formyltransferase [Chlamydiota bacterium]